VTLQTCLNGMSHPVAAAVTLSRSGWLHSARCGAGNASTFGCAFATPTTPCRPTGHPRKPSGFPLNAFGAISPMTTKSRQSIYGASVRAAPERAKEARREADRLPIIQSAMPPSTNAAAPASNHEFSLSVRRIARG
jgi:hypothetical protein